MRICSSCGNAIGYDEESSFMQLSTKPGSRTYNNYQLCEKCHYKIMALLATANKVNEMANNG